MPLLVPLLVVHIVTVLQPAVSLLTANVGTIPGRVGSCPVPEKRDEAFQNLTADVRVLTQTVTNIAREPGD